MSTALYISWAERIAEAWAQSATAIIKTGTLLIEAQESLDHGEWLPMLGQIGFHERKAQRLMEIARDERLSNPSILTLLPDQWTRMHKVHKLKMDVPQLEKHLREMQAINGARAIMGSRQEPDDSLDFFPTPPWATRALIRHVIGELPLKYNPRNKIVWEPACGEGHMAEVLAEYFSDVIATDIFDYGYGETCDFLNAEASPPECDWIITNPPFGDKTEQFVLHASYIADCVAMFVRLQWLEGVGRYERIFRDHPPTQIAFFAERVNLCKGRWEPEGSTATAYVWLVWIKGEKPRAPVWIPPGRCEELTKPDDAERFTAHPVFKKIHQHAAHSPAACEPASVNSPIAPDAGSTSSEDEVHDIPQFLRRSNPALDDDYRVRREIKKELLDFPKILRRGQSE